MPLSPRNDALKQVVDLTAQRRHYTHSGYDYASLHDAARQRRLDGRLGVGKRLQAVS